MRVKLVRITVALVTIGLSNKVLASTIDNGSKATNPLMIFDPNSEIDFPISAFQDALPGPMAAFESFLKGLNADSVYESELDPKTKAIIFRSFKSRDTATKLPAMRFHTIINTNINTLASIWFANNERKGSWIQYCEKLDGVKRLPVKAITPNILRWGEYQRFYGVSPAPLFVWARSFVTQTYFARSIDPNNEYIAMISSSADDATIKSLIEEAYHQNIDRYNEMHKHVFAEIIFSTAMLRPISKEQTYIDFAVVLDPSGDFPAWVIELVQNGWPKTTWEQIKNITADQEVLKKFTIHNFLAKDLDPKILSKTVIP